MTGRSGALGNESKRNRSLLPQVWGGGLRAASGSPAIAVVAIAGVRASVKRVVYATIADPGQLHSPPRSLQTFSSRSNMETKIVHPRQSPPVLRPATLNRAWLHSQK